VVGLLEVGTTKTEEVSDEERSLKEKFVGVWVRVMWFGGSSNRVQEESTMSDLSFRQGPFP
jgi:hypothetical protein